MARRGRPGKARQGRVRQGRLGLALLGEGWRGVARQAGRGRVRRGTERQAVNLSKVEVPRGEQKLIAAVVALALEDAASKPGKGLPTQEASTALEFLFTPGSMLELYLPLLDMDVGVFRQNLLKAMYARPVQPCGSLTETQVRCLRINYERLLAVKGVELVA